MVGRTMRRGGRRKRGVGELGAGRQAGRMEGFTEDHSFRERGPVNVSRIGRVFCYGRDALNFISGDKYCTTEKHKSQYLSLNVGSDIRRKRKWGERKRGP